MSTRLDPRPHPATGRPVYQGLPVPWITRWSGENYPHGSGPAVAFAALHGRLHIAYADPWPADHPLGVAAGFAAQRDELGLLWYRDRPHRQGVGVPEFSALHAGRQRACMLERRCQVCGRHFAGDEPVTFLESATLRDSQGVHYRNRNGASLPYRTLTAPCCRTCIPVAMGRCPAQRGHSRMIVAAGAYHPACVVGDVYNAVDGGTLEAPSVQADLDDPMLSRMVVKQLGVEVTDYTEEPWAA